MKYVFFGIILFLALGAGLGYYFDQRSTDTHTVFSGSTDLPDVLPDETPVVDEFLHPRLQGLDEWVRPEGPIRVGLQAGHWQAAEAPDELENLRFNTGATAAGRTEWQVALAIAEAAKEKLEPHGIVVEILPTTIPENYYADIFLSIHADGNLNTGVSGYKLSAPRRDYTGEAEKLVEAIESTYGAATGLGLDPNVTRQMRGYYAFNWRRYNHSIHPKTVAGIIETGYLTSPRDRHVIVGAPHVAAEGIVGGILQYLGTTELGREKGIAASNEG